MCVVVSFIRFGKFLAIISSNFFFFFWSYRTACGILVPQPGIEPGLTAVKARGVLTTGPLGNSLFKYFFFPLLSFPSETPVMHMLVCMVEKKEST